MNIKKIVKKTLCSLLVGIPLAIGAQSKINLPEGYEFFDITKYHRFEKFVTVTKIYNKNKVGWLVYNTKEKDIICNNSDEIDDYQKYAEMAQSKELMESLTADDVRTMASLYARGLVGYEIAYKIPNFAMEKGSNLGGKVVNKIITGGLDLPNDVQKEIVKKLIEEEKKEIVDEFYKKIFGDEEIVNPIEAANKVKDYLLNTVEARLGGASLKLNRAAEILEKGRKQELSYDEYKEFLDNFIEGNSTGRAYLNAIDRIRKNVDPMVLTQKIVKNMSKGLDIKDDIETISMYTNDLLNVDLASFLFGNGDFMDVFNDVEKEYLAERGRLFKILEGKYNLKEGSVSAKIIEDLCNFKNEDLDIKEKICDIIKRYDGDGYWDSLSKEGFVIKCVIKDVDLNNDGINEFFGVNENFDVNGVCGTGGCLHLIFGHDGKIIGERGGFGFEIQKKKTNGYYDIIAFVKNYSAFPECNPSILNKHLMKWDGEKYIEREIIRGKECEEEKSKELENIVKKEEPKREEISKEIEHCAIKADDFNTYDVIEVESIDVISREGLLDEIKEVREIISREVFLDEIKEVIDYGLISSCKIKHIKISGNHACVTFAVGHSCREDSRCEEQNINREPESRVATYPEIVWARTKKVSVIKENDSWKINSKKCE